MLDELTTFLDVKDQDRVLQTVRALVDGKSVDEDSKSPKGKDVQQESDASKSKSHNPTALWVTHRLKELEWADGALLVDGGRIVCIGSPQDVLRMAKRS